MLFEEISPLLAKYYRKLRSKFNDPEEALEALWGEKKNGVDYSDISSLLDPEELNSLSNSPSEFGENMTPEIFFRKYKDILNSGQSALDRFIRRQNERKNKNVLNIQIALKELQLLVQEGLISSQYSRDIVDFSHTLSKLIDSDPSLIKEMTSLLSNLPNAELKWLFTLEKYFLRADSPIPNDLKPSSTPVLGALMKNRTLLLSESEKRFLFDQQGDIQKNASLTGRSRVTYFSETNPEFYLKQYPEWPGYEFASILFMQLLGVTQLPYLDLIIINSKYPVLLAQKVHGDPVFRIWKDPQVFHNLDPVHTGLLLISAMLLNPEDGKEDNFILSKDGRYLIPIDNDHSFLPSTFRKEGSLWNAFTVNTALQTKTLLFCLDEMYMQIPLEVRQRVQSINFDELLAKWMVELDKLENKFNNLIDQNQRNEFLEQGTVMRIPFYKQFLHNLHWKVHKIQAILKTDVRVTPFDLLKAVEPFAARCYEDAFKQESDLQSRFKAATNNLYRKTAVDGSRVSVLNTRTMMEIINVSEKDLLNDVIFHKMGPVDALELLNQLIQERSQKIAMEQDLLCELDEKKHANKWISLFGNPPVKKALKAFFANPKEGLVLRGSKLITSSKLTELFAQTPDRGMRIRFLSLPQSSSLTSEGIRILAEGSPNLEYLNVSDCVKLKEILTTDGEWALLSRLEAKNCSSLKKFVSYSPIKILQIGTDQEIEIFIEKSTLEIFTARTKIHESEFSFKKGESFCIKFRYSSFSSDDFGRSLLDPWGWDRTKDCFQDIKITIGMSSISVENLVVYITNVKFQSSKVQIDNIRMIVTLNLVHLKRLDLSSHEIRDEGSEILTHGNWPFLEMLNLQSTKITAVRVGTIVKQSNWSRLKNLNLSWNRILDEGLEILSLGNWSLLETLNLAWTDGTKKGFLHILLNYIKWPNLKKIDLEPDRKFPERLCRSNWHQLEELKLTFSKITHNEIAVIVKRSNWPQLKILDLSQNKINDEGLEILSQGNWPVLENLNLESTKITSKGVEALAKRSNWPRLKILDLSWNKINDEGLEILTQGNWPFLETLNLTLTGVTKKRVLYLSLSLNWPSLQKLILAHHRDILAREWPLAKDWHRYEEFDLSNGQITSNEIAVIINQYKLPQLKTLYLSQCQIKDEGIQILAQGNWPLLEILKLNCTKITGVGVQTMINQHKWTQLKNLDLSINEITDKGIQLITQRNWPVLEILNLSSTKITAVGVEVFIKRSHWPRLKELDLSLNELRDEGIQILTQGNWPELEILNLASTKMTTLGVEALVMRSNWPQLKNLDLSWNQITDKRLEVLTQTSWPSLKDLRLIETYIAKKDLLNPAMILILSNLKEASLDEWEEGFVQSLLPENWYRLQTLDLSSGKITQNEIQILVSQFKFPQLNYLNLSFNEIHDEGLEILTQGNWPLLEVLDLISTKITSVGIEIMVKKSNWSQLKHLDLSLNQISNKGLEIITRGNWQFLRTLNLDKTDITSEAFTNFLLHANWPDFKRIFLSECQDPAHKELAYNFIKKDLSQMEQLELNNHAITFNHIETILNEYRCPQLKHLNISENDISLEGILVLVLADCPLLEELHIENIKITPKGIESIVNQSKWQHLKHFNISRNDIFDKGLSALVLAEWSLLEYLNLSNTKLSMKSVKTIVNQSRWPHLKHLNLSHNEISDEGLSLLALATWPLLENLNLSNTKLSLTNAHQPKWFQLQLKYLDLSQNRISDKGFLELTCEEWPLLEELKLKNTQLTPGRIKTLVNRMKLPNLKKLDISENAILDEGLKALMLGRWPLFEHLVYYDTQVTLKGNIDLLESFQWPNLHDLEHSLSGSFYNFNKGLNQWSASKLILAMAPMYYKTSTGNEQSLLVSVFNISWLNSKEIYLSINHDGFHGKIMILPREKLIQFETIDFSLNLSLVQFIVWPSNLKTLDFSKNSTLDFNRLENFLLKKSPSLECLCLCDPNITTYGLKNFIRGVEWLNLKKLAIYFSPIEGEKLEVLTSAKLQFIEDLNLTCINLTAQGTKILARRSNWPNLRKLNLSLNQIKDDGLEILTSAKWQLLEELNLTGTEIRAQGIEALISQSNWPNFKRLRISGNPIKDQGLKTLASAKWGLLEDLNLNRLKITAQGISVLARKPDWPYLRKLNISESPIGDKGLEILGSVKWRLLEDLNLMDTKSTARGIDALVRKSDWPSLRKFHIGVNPIGNEGLEILASIKWRILEDLNLMKTEITALGVEALVRKSDWPNLKKLFLGGNEILDAGLELLSSGKWPMLEKLYLQELNITGRGVERMVKISDWPKMKTLDISYNEQIFDGGLEALSSEKWPLLECLCLCNPKISLQDVEALVDKSSWSNLKEIFLEEDEKDDDKAAAIQQLISRKWPNLKLMKDYKVVIGLEFFIETFGEFKFSEKIAKILRIE